ncbi:DNA cross-link repair protein SNM1-like isoform X2 [Cajanus cajan]|uniref:DNA cross-link repair protein SNM1-like isoform X2 n=1 Tax=Cajanus cajan TaxID=3821 RepID=UPI0010FB804A|nr:DNA cross-link repair protein SNM1-like isoform X2 [Cajanus cajan]
MRYVQRHGFARAALRSGLQRGSSPFGFVERLLNLCCLYGLASRRRILLAFGWPELSDSLYTKTLKDYLKTYKEQFTAILAFRPTGFES